MGCLLLRKVASIGNDAVFDVFDTGSLKAPDISAYVAWLVFPAQVQ